MMGSSIVSLNGKFGDLFFTVANVDLHATTGAQFRSRIAAQILEDTGNSFHPASLRAYSTLCDGVYASEDDSNLITSALTEVKPTKLIFMAFPIWGDGVLHFVVEQNDKPVEQTKIDNRKRKMEMRPFSKLTADDLADMVDPKIEDTAFDPPKAEITDAKEIELFFKAIKSARDHMDPWESTSEQSRRSFIDLILRAAMHQSKHSAEITLGMEVPMPCQELKVNGNADYVIRKGKRVLCIVEAKVANPLATGIIQLKAMMESCRHQQHAKGGSLSTPVFGIVTNWCEWVFVRRDESRYGLQTDTLSKDEEEFKTGSNRIVRKIAGMIDAL
jgi:hypothetical protein